MSGHKSLRCRIDGQPRCLIVWKTSISRGLQRRPSHSRAEMDQDHYSSLDSSRLTHAALSDDTYGLCNPERTGILSAKASCDHARGFMLCGTIGDPGSEAGLHPTMHA